jgi:hypothetical protein
MTMIHYILIVLTTLNISCGQNKQVKLNWTQPDVKGHWKLWDTEIVEEVPFLNLKASVPDSMRRVGEDSPWDSYRKFDLVFENDSIYTFDYPIEAFTPVHYYLDSGYLYAGSKDQMRACPVEMVNDTLILYRPLRSDPGYFKEKYLRTNFNDTILNLLKTYGINYPALAGTWTLVREEDFDYGTHYELTFPHTIPDSIVFTKEQMIVALDHEKIYKMKTDGIKRDYTFYYENNRMYLKPGNWYKGEDAWIYFYKN